MKTLGLLCATLFTFSTLAKDLAISPKDRPTAPDSALFERDAQNTEKLLGSWELHCLNQGGAQIWETSQYSYFKSGFTQVLGTLYKDAECTEPLYTRYAEYVSEAWRSKKESSATFFVVSKKLGETRYFVNGVEKADLSAKIKGQLITGDASQKFLFEGEKLFLHVGGGRTGLKVAPVKKIPVQRLQSEPLDLKNFLPRL